MKSKRSAPDFILFVIVLLLLTVGIVMVYSSSYVYAQIAYADGAHFLKNQLIWAFVGIAGMLVVMNIDYKIYRKWAYPIFGIAVFLLLLLLVPGVGITIKDATRWIGVAVKGFNLLRSLNWHWLFFWQSTWLKDRIRSSSLLGV
ncbi:MAG: FtsW/RodA/SpoVE family cell cycle protein [Syntrophaceticus schinkii]